jgi:hypothetical protein
MKITKKSAALATMGAAALLTVTALGGCSKLTEQFRDAPRSSVVNSQPADVIEMPDGFNNVATKCDHGNRIYISFHGDGSYGFGFAVKDDPTCAP